MGILGTNDNELARQLQADPNYFQWGGSSTTQGAYGDELAALGTIIAATTAPNLGVGTTTATAAAALGSWTPGPAQGYVDMNKKAAVVAKDYSKLSLSEIVDEEVKKILA